MTATSFFLLVEEYLAFRRGLGFDLESAGWMLQDFAKHAERVGHHGPLTLDLAVQWATSSSSKDPGHAARRLATVRAFARYRLAFDPATQIPPNGLLGGVRRRRQPHIYSQKEITALLKQCRLLLPRSGLRPKTYVAFFSLLASTGLRVSEARRLGISDVDLTEGVLTVRRGKFRKSRLIPLHATATYALTRYAALRQSRCSSASGHFFRTDRAPALTYNAVHRTFSRIRERLGWTAQGRASRPRIHDLRHTFAVRRLLRWYEEGVDVDRKILSLATYLGHSHVTATYWYLSAVPELLAIASRRFERCARQEQEGAL